LGSRPKTQKPGVKNRGLTSLKGPQKKGGNWGKDKPPTPKGRIWPDPNIKSGDSDIKGGVHWGGEHPQKELANPQTWGVEGTPQKPPPQGERGRAPERGTPKKKGQPKGAKRKAAY